MPSVLGANRKEGTSIFLERSNEGVSRCDGLKRIRKCGVIQQYKETTCYH